MAAPTTDLADDRLVIALDFGTTFSGVAYAFNVPGKKADVVSIMDWPGLGGVKQPKVPTLILYDENNPSKFKWGGQVDWRDPAVHGVKLLLDPDQPRPAYLPVSCFKKDLSSLPKDPVDVAADFIEAIYKHALAKIESAGVRDYFNFCQKQFILSVPAVWSDKAKDLTLKAAKKAGIHPVTLIKEPEAAALYTLSCHDHSFEVGDSFVVCDAGGGTVDLITYEVSKMKPYLQLAELVPGTGGMAGSLGLNKRFEEAVRLVVGDEQFLELRNSVPGWGKASKEFDNNIKTAFTGDITEVHYVMFPKAGLEDDPIERIYDNCWEMTGDTLQDIFEPIIVDILRLVDAQVKDSMLKRPNKGLKGIFLVGGFGSSRYLKQRLEKEYETMGIQVIQPHDAWGAIVKGAVLSRVSNQATVVSTQAVRHYGTTAWAEYDPIADRGRPVKHNMDQDGKVRVEKVTWYIYMGEDLRRDHTIKFSFVRSVKQHHSNSDLIFHDSLVYSETKAAPTYPGPDVKTSCKLVSNLSSVDKSFFTKRIGVDGDPYLDIHYHLVISTAAANMKFSLEIEGTEIGSVEATYT
ncbi:hypothetical protein VP1G_08476 [Cytospora mali]|uniref:Heat shock 70 kDa protein 12A n=1 Tax=Cytospora mali TaxID=578113 RepID=A0A194VBC2_CYTMA|nr:hypothetical protein VP1G_08476 [Valsa mali var. pyri (nom. inval.)]